MGAPTSSLGQDFVCPQMTTKHRERGQSFPGVEAFVLSFMTFEMATSPSDGSNKCQNALFFSEKGGPGSQTASFFKGRFAILGNFKIWIVPC